MSTKKIFVDIVYELGGGDLVTNLEGKWPEVLGSIGGRQPG